jgi:hypothetical protein
MRYNFLTSSSLAAALFWTAAIVCIVAHVGILRSVLRAKPRRALEMAWAVLPAMALAAVLLVTWRRMHAGL